MKFRIRTTPLKHLGAERSTESVYTASAFDDASPRHMLNKASPSIHHCSWISTPPHTPVDSCLRRNDGGTLMSFRSTPMSFRGTHVIPSVARNLPPTQPKGVKGMLCQLLAAPTHLPVHPPLTSLRSLAPPYASEGGVHLPTPLWIPAFAGMTGGTLMSFRSTPHVIPSVARNLPPSWNARGLGGCLPTAVRWRGGSCRTPGSDTGWPCRSPTGHRCPLPRPRSRSNSRRCCCQCRTQWESATRLSSCPFRRRWRADRRSWCPNSCS